MIIQMVWQMSGGRYDDRVWPSTGMDFEVPDEEGAGLIRAGAAVQVPYAPALESAPSPVPEPALVTAAAWQPTLEPEPAPAPAPVSAPTAMTVLDQAYVPVTGDPKAAWVEYAVSRGAAQAEAEGMTKAQLQAAYGGRL